jgi:hypothetical protein
LLPNMMNLISVVIAICGFRLIQRSSDDLYKDLVLIATCQQELTPSSLFIPTKCQMDTKQHTCKLSVLIDLRSCNHDVSDTPLAVIELITPAAPVQKWLICQQSNFAQQCYFYNGWTFHDC